MKSLTRYFVALLVAVPFLLGGCKKEIYITGTLPEELNGKHVYMSLLSAPDNRVDSVLIENPSQVQIRVTSLQEGEAYCLSYEGMQETSYFVMTKKYPLTIEPEFLTIGGGEENNRFAEMMKKLGQEFETDAEFTALFVHAKDFFESYPNSLLSLVAFDICMRTTENPMDLLPLVQKAGDKLKEHQGIQETTKALGHLQKTQAGNLFVDFSGEDAKGNAVKLSDYVNQGQYVLVDFWASWCSPCRKSIPGIKKIYNKYRHKGLAVVGVSVWEDNKKDHLDAVRALNIPWPQIIDLSADRVATTAYGIMGIPHLILFAPDGTIVARDLRVENLEETIAPLYR